VVIEFGHLRTTLSRATLEFARQHRWDLSQLEEALEAINDILDEATAESVRQFQDDSRSETQTALAEVKKRQSAIEDAWITAKLERSKLRRSWGACPSRSGWSTPRGRSSASTTRPCGFRDSR